MSESDHDEANKPDRGKQPRAEGDEKTDPFLDAQNADARFVDRIVYVHASKGGETTAPKHAENLETDESFEGFASRYALPGIRQKGRRLFESVRFNWVYFISLIAVLSILSANWWTASIIAGSQFARFRITSATILDPEPQKMVAADNPMMRLIAELGNYRQPGEFAMVFRQAEFAFYAPDPFVYYLDNSFAYLYQTDSIDELHSSLLSENVRYLVLPDYSRAEVENSFFEQLLADPRRTQLLYEFNDYRLFRIRDEEIDTPIITVLEERFDGNPEALDGWHLARTPPGIWETISTLLGVANEGAAFTRDRDAGFVQVSRERSFRARPELFDILQRTRLQPDISPYVLDESDFDASLGTLRFEADVEGDGYFEVVLASFSRDGSEVIREQQLLWSGVLFEGDRRTISGQFVDLSYTPFDSDLADRQRLYRVLFRLRDGGYARLYGWEVEHFPEIDPIAQNRVRQYLTPLNNGWSLLEGELERRDLYFSAPETDPDPEDAFIAVGFNRYDSRPLGVLSPTWAAPRNLFNDDVRRAANLYSSTIRPTISVETVISGHGVLDLNLLVQCLITPGEDLTLSQNDSINLGTVLLTGAPRQESLTAELPCLPIEVRLGFATRRNNLIVEHDLSLSEITVLELDFKLRFLDENGLPVVSRLNLVNEQRRWRPN